MPERTEQWLTIGEAAEAVGVSRRTVERWIKAGRLKSKSSETDRRKRLVQLNDVQRVRNNWAHGRSEISTPSEEEKLKTTAALEPAPISPQPDPQQRRLVDQQTIDNTLQLVFSHCMRLMRRLHPLMVKEVSLEQLRHGPMGSDLELLAGIARGELSVSTGRVLEAIESILQMLFWPPGSYHYQMPRSFLDTDLGRMLSIAKFRSYEPGDLMTVGEAANELGVGRPMIYRWMDDRTLGYVRDVTSGRTFVIRDDVSWLKRTAQAMEPRP